MKRVKVTAWFAFNRVYDAFLLLGFVEKCELLEGPEDALFDKLRKISAIEDMYSFTSLTSSRKADGAKRGPTAPHPPTRPPRERDLLQTERTYYNQGGLITTGHPEGDLLQPESVWHLPTGSCFSAQWAHMCCFAALVLD